MMQSFALLDKKIKIPLAILSLDYEHLKVNK